MGLQDEERKKTKKVALYQARYTSVIMCVVINSVYSLYTCTQVVMLNINTLLFFTD